MARTVALEPHLEEMTVVGFLQVLKVHQVVVGQGGTLVVKVLSQEIVVIEQMGSV